MRLRMLALASLFLCTISVLAQVSTIDPSSAKWVAVPGSIIQVSSKYPVTHLVLYQTKCNQPGTDKLVATDTYTLQISGPGSTASAAVLGDCTLDFDLTSTSVNPGDQLITITETTPEVPAAGSVAAIPKVLKPLGFAVISFADPKAGPIPGAKQVDVMWGLIGYHVCSDAFGKDITQHFYCIAVEIGNNSGYSLQIVGMGFEQNSIKTPTSSYLITRAVAQNGQTEGFRNRAYLELQAGGLLMTGVTPYFHNARSASRFATATSIVSGPLLAAYNLIFPDPSGRQGNNLDDQAFRDGKLIPNNTQIRTIVFLDRDSTTLHFQACDVYKYAPAVVPTSETPEAASARKQEDVRNATSMSKQWHKCNQTQSESSSAVRAALGNLVVVGDPVFYLQRIVVDQNVTSQEVAVTPHPGLPVAHGSTLAFTGTNMTLMPDSLVLIGTISGEIITATAPAKTATSAVYTLTPALGDSEGFTVKPSGDSAIPVPLTGKATAP